MRTAARFAGRTLAWIVILVASAMIVAAVLIPRLTGSTPYTVLTGSMEPAYPPGTLVVVRPVDPRGISVGDVVTIQLESGKESFVTHRIAAIQHRADGDVQFVTKGDANDVVDADVRLPVQVRGKVWYHVPYLGYVSTALTGSQRGWIVIAVAAALLGYAGWMFAGAWRGRHSARSRLGIGDEDPSDGAWREAEGGPSDVGKTSR